VTVAHRIFFRPRVNDVRLAIVFVRIAAVGRLLTPDRLAVPADWRRGAVFADWSSVVAHVLFSPLSGSEPSLVPDALPARSR
jgi:hypothetical protein